MIYTECRPSPFTAELLIAERGTYFKPPSHPAEVAQRCAVYFIRVSWCASFVTALIPSAAPAC